MVSHTVRIPIASNLVCRGKLRNENSRWDTHAYAERERERGRARARHSAKTNAAYDLGACTQKLLGFVGAGKMNENYDVFSLSGPFIWRWRAVIGVVVVQATVDYLHKYKCRLQD